MNRIINTLYFSTYCLSHNHSFPDILAKFEKLGVRNVELGVNLDNSLDYGKIIRDYDFEYIIHQYFPPPKTNFIINLASENKKILDSSLNQIINSLDFCSDNKIDLISFHSGFRSDPSNDFKFNSKVISPYETAFNIFKDSIIKLAEYAKERDIKIAIENNVLAEYNLKDNANKYLLFCEEWEFERLFNEIDYDNVGILLDLGHLKVTTNTLGFNIDEFIKNLKNKVVAVHIHENNGKIDQHRCISKGDRVFKILDTYFKDSEVLKVLECDIKNEDEIVKYINLLE